ncbi:hypothetical protein K5V21_13870 [Clostridium sardiniense]|uniref:DUF1653 domain-containing protein n=1 Tax=Clostridium sardiniense TaxID=29369 RepID=A0ABS7L0D9_CLOSR|nr:hypothetical protein [Clostridium sardiniense]MBY0756531.1 hypothetical protein [Clostridium sardiniense]MDQ0460279.1 hypothetical protein [Clostridium sardiniense]
MKLKEGQDVKLVHRDYHYRAKEYYGKVNKIYKRYILLDLNNYKTCVLLADIIDPVQNILKIKKKKKWINVTKEMLEAGVVS